MALSREGILKVFKDTGALLEGHFILTSGLHSDKYFQCAKVFQYPRHAEALCREITARYRGKQIDVVVSPAVGGIVVGQEIARLLGVRSIFTERVEGKMTFRRGFEIAPGEKALVAEDVTTTGGSVREVMEAVREQGGVIVGVTGVVDRSGGKAEFGVPYFSLLKMDAVANTPESCPLCRSGSIAVKPGSRGLK
ncbi:MAG TPA: orotate phosphoribosyltransferase [bacterium]